MYCEKYEAGECRSCQWLELPAEQQLRLKQDNLFSLLPTLSPAVFQPPVASASVRFRNKAKMVISGSVEKPVFGIINPQGQAVSLTHCPLY